MAVVAVVSAVLFYALWRGRVPAAADVVSLTIYPPEKAAFPNSLNLTVNVPQFALAGVPRHVGNAAGFPVSTR